MHSRFINVCSVVGIVSRLHLLLAPLLHGPGTSQTYLQLRTETREQSSKECLIPDP